MQRRRGLRRRVAVQIFQPDRAAGELVGAEGQGSMKAQFKKADASGARHAVVFGPDELARGQVGLKDLRNPATPQAAVALDPVDALVSRIKNASTRAS